MILVSAGMLIICSASPTLGVKLGDSFYFIKRHVLYLLLGLLAMYYGTNLDLNWLKKNANILFVLSFLLLLLVYLPGLGKNISGASRWIEIAGLTLQPSELAKFSIILFLARLLSDKKNNLFQALFIITVVCVVIMKQPDMGTTIMIAAISLVMLFLSGVNVRYLLAIAGSGIAAVTFLAISTPYRLKRLVAYLDPWKDPQGKGFQIIQSLLAVGSGGLTGLGLGASRQKYFYLPQQFTDFVFAICCEEFGFIGALFLILCFCLFAQRALKITQTTKDDFSFLLAAGLTAWISLQALLNMLVVVGLIPTTGIPLPFISYGGTAVIMVLFSCGILLNLSKEET
jgi:cell division protein FtsW